MKFTLAPSLAIAIDWLHPLPPGPILYLSPSIVSPTAGIFEPEKLISATNIPKTEISLFSQA